MKKNLLLQEYMIESIKEIKIRQKDIAIEAGVNLRTVRLWKKKKLEKFNLINDALKYRRVTGGLDIRIKRIVDNLKNNTFFAYNLENRIIQLDIKVSSIISEKMVGGKLKEFHKYTMLINDITIPLSEKEILNLMRDDISETTVSNIEYRDSLKKMELFL